MASQSRRSATSDSWLEPVLRAEFRAARVVAWKSLALLGARYQGDSLAHSTVEGEG
jgi:hypothetical protein